MVVFVICRGFGCTKICPPVHEVTQSYAQTFRSCVGLLVGTKGRNLFWGGCESANDATVSVSIAAVVGVGIVAVLTAAHGGHNCAMGALPA